MDNYCVDDLLMHFREGLVIVKEQTIINGNSYLVLTTVKTGGESIFVPVDKADAIIRRITTKEQAKDLIEYIKTIEPEYVTNTKQRRDAFKRKLNSGDIKDLAYLARQLYFFQNPELLEKPVKFGPADVEMLKYASRTMYDELSITYNVDRDSIEGIVLKEVYSR